MKKVFIITGTSRGIGKQLAEFYLSKGHQVRDAVEENQK